MKHLGILLRCELRLVRRHGGDTAASVLFFVLAASCFPLALDGGPALLRRLAPAVLPVCALFATTLPLERLLGADGEDGTLDQLLLSGASLLAIGASKALAHWATTTLPMLVAALLLAPALALPPRAVPVAVAALGLAGATFSLVGTLLAALLLGARRGGVLLPLLALPLLTPVLIFAAAALDAAAAGTSPLPFLLLLGALPVGFAVPALWAAGAALEAAAAT